MILRSTSAGGGQRLLRQLVGRQHLRVLIAVKTTESEDDDALRSRGSEDPLALLAADRVVLHVGGLGRGQRTRLGGTGLAIAHIALTGDEGVDRLGRVVAGLAPDP